MTTEQAARTVRFRPGVTYLAGSAQIGAGIWLLFVPYAWSIGILEMALGVATVVLAARSAVNLLWITALAPLLVGGLLVFSGGLLVALPGVVVIVAIAIDVLISRIRA